MADNDSQAPIDPSKLVFLDKPDDPVPQPKIILPDGSVLEGRDVAGMTDADFAAMVDLGEEDGNYEGSDDDLRSAYEATGEAEDDE